MRWSNSRTPFAHALLLAAAALLLLLTAPSAEEKRLTIFAQQRSYTVAVVDRDSREYVSLLELLQPLGRLDVTNEGAKWKFKLNGAQAEFEVGKDRAKVRGNKVSLGGNFLEENANPLLPMRSVPALLTSLLDTRVDYHEAARRLFIGNAGTHFTAELTKAGEVSTLALKFTAPVNPMISTEPGSLRMTFTKDPVVASAARFAFEDQLIPGAAYSEANGISELTVTGTAPLMATFADGGRTILISAAPSAATAPTQQPASVPSAAASTPPATSTTAATPPPIQIPQVPAVGPHRFLVVIDPGHGGDETGAAFNPKLLEKDLTLSLARRLHAELENRGINAILIRDGDFAVSPDQRAIISNANRAAVYISLHAGTPGERVRVYTALLPQTSARPGAFLPWSTAQSAYLDSSGTLAASIADELNKEKIPAARLPGPVRPLNNIAAAAVAVEITPPGKSPDSMADTKYQQNVAVAVANGVVAARAKLEGSR